MLCGATGGGCVAHAAAIRCLGVVMRAGCAPRYAIPFARERWAGHQCDAVPYSLCASDEAAQLPAEVRCGHCVLGNIHCIPDPGCYVVIESIRAMGRQGIGPVPTQAHRQFATIHASMH